ncbi:hypothetical protein, partial [Escherichia coli]
IFRWYTFVYSENNKKRVEKSRQNNTAVPKYFVSKNQALVINVALITVKSSTLMNAEHSSLLNFNEHVDILNTTTTFHHMSFTMVKNH